MCALALPALVVAVAANFALQRVIIAALLLMLATGTGCTFYVPLPHPTMPDRSRPGWIAPEGVCVPEWSTACRLEISWRTL